MSKRMEGAPQMSPQGNEWVSREEYDELRDHTNSLEAKVDNLSAQIAEMQRTQQLLLEKISDIRKEDVEQKDSTPRGKLRSKLGAVATSAAAFFGKFFHRGKDLGDFHEEKSSKGANRGAHAKGKEKEKEKEKEKGGNPIVSARRDEKSKISREQEDKPNKNKTSGIGKKIVAGALALALVAGSAVAAFSPHKNAQDLPQNPTNERTVDMNNLRVPEIEQALAEQDAEAARQQQLAETMGMSVEDMHAVADRHGVNHNDIGTVKAHDQMRDNMESSYNLSEKIDLENMSEAERSERSKQEILFANMNNKYVTAQISSARLGAHDASDSELTQRLFSQYEENDAVWQEQAKENAKILKESTYSIRSAGTSKTYTYGTENQWDGLIEKQYVAENSGGETVYIVEVTNGNIKIQFKDGCVQAVWVEEVAQPRQQVKERTVVQREVVRQEEHYQEAQGELRKEEHGQEEGERRTPPSDAKDEHADDPQEDPENKVTETPKSTDQAEASEDKQADKNGDGLPDSSGKSKSNNGEDDIKGKQGDTGEDRPANKNNTEADNGGSGSGEHVAGGGNQGGSGEGGTGSNRADSGGGGKETSQNSQEGSSSWTRKWGSKESSSWRIGSDGKKVESSESSSYDTGRVERNGNSNDAANGNVELLSSSVPISQED